MKKKEIFRYIKGKKERFLDNIVDEYQIKLFVNQKEIFLFQTFPLNIDELAIGFLYSKGIISSIKDIKQSTFDKLTNEYYVHIKNGLEINSNGLRSINSTFLDRVPLVKPMKSSLFLEKDKIVEFMEKLNHLSEVFDKTGAVHTTAISNTTEIEYYYDDIGRHNAIDKCLGKALINNTGLENKILLVTCRISSGIISKLINARIPFIISRAPPTAYAIELGEKYGITVIGFCRGSRFNVYSHIDRLK